MKLEETCVCTAKFVAEDEDTALVAGLLANWRDSHRGCATHRPQPPVGPVGFVTP